MLSDGVGDRETDRMTDRYKEGDISKVARQKR